MKLILVIFVVQVFFIIKIEAVPAPSCPETAAIAAAPAPSDPCAWKCLKPKPGCACIRAPCYACKLSEINFCCCFYLSIFFKGCYYPPPPPDYCNQLQS